MARVCACRCPGHLNDEWFSDEDALKKKLGIVAETPDPDPSAVLHCTALLQNFPVVHGPKTLLYCMAPKSFPQHPCIGSLRMC